MLGLNEYEVGAQAAPGVGQARANGYPIRTPVIVEEMDSTTLVLPGYAVAGDRYGSLLISPAGDSP